ncbi:MAG: Eco57I restriction-modification methylase domain-containing protein [Tannerella sp.]|jgi:hypothetical protein|nr:Eco57I restriction-modification methylase domain-containing protein [Tannerella sp.]
MTATDPYSDAPSAPAAQPDAGDGYRLLVRRLDLKEIGDGADAFLTPVQGRGWTPDFAAATDAMNLMHAQYGIAPDRILATLALVIERLDRTAPLPHYAVAYICRDAVTRVVLQRFNEAIGCNCTGLRDLSYTIGDNVAEANATFATFRFCDPAAGSGRFLVALMNEIVAVKSQLGILADSDGNPLYQYSVGVDGGRLVTLDKRRFSPCALDPANPETRRIQDALMREKRLCIEKCLYGVDIDPVATGTCRLRLWHELLVHAGRLPFDTPPPEGNIRCGDALVSRFAVHDDLKAVFRRIGFSLADYRALAGDFKRATSGEERERLARIIDMINKRMQHESASDDRRADDLRKWQRERERLTSPSLFAPDGETEKIIAAKVEEANMMIDKYRRKAEEAGSNPVYEKAVEWRYEFPGLLNDAGDFAGFDAVAGNPPDTRKEIADATDAYRQAHYRTFKQTGEVLSLFCELGHKLLRQDGILSFIASNSWMRSVSAGKMRQFLTEEMNPLTMLDFAEPGHAVAGMPGGKGILVLQKSRNRRQTATCRVGERFDPQRMRLEDYVALHAVPSLIGADGQADGAAASFGILPETEKSIRSKIEQVGTPLRMWDIRLHEGIRTGCDEAFIIDSKTKDGFVRADYKNTDIIKPLLPDVNVRRYTPAQSDRWLICIPWHFPLLYDKSITQASVRAEERFAQQYPLIYEHLLLYKDRLLLRDAPGVGVTFEWYALQRLAVSGEWDDFTQQKIVWRQEAPASDFCFDYGGCAVLGATCFIIGQHLKYLLGFLNSRLGQYMLKDSPRMSSGDMQISILALEALRVPAPGVKIEADIVSLVNKRTSDTNPTEQAAIDEKIDSIVYGICGLTRDETDYIEKEMNHS